MSSQFRIVYTVPSNARTVIDKLRLFDGSGSVDAGEQMQRIASYTDAISDGSYQGKMQVATSAVAASGTVTFSSIATGDTVTIGATVFTGATSPTGAQFQTNVTPSGAADIVAATSLAAVINSNATTSKLVTATSDGAVVTITAQVPGLLGNFFPIAISAHGSVSGSGKLTSGAEDANITLKKGVA